MAKRRMKPRRDPGAIDPADIDTKQFDEVEEADGAVLHSEKATKTKTKTSSIDGSRETVDLDETYGKKRKISKKEQARLDQWENNDVTEIRDVMMNKLMQLSKDKFGHGGLFAGTNWDKLIVGLPMPALSLEWLIGQDVLPLSTVYLLNGPPGSCKSALLYEMFRWFANAKGIGRLFDTELKLSKTLLPSIMGYTKMEHCPVLVQRCYTVEDCQEKFTQGVRDIKHVLEGTAEEPGPGRKIPVALGIDSVMGRGSQEDVEKILKEGSANRGWPVGTLKYTRYLRTMIAPLIENWPFAVILLNHFKEAANEQGQIEVKKPGGDFQQYQGSVELRTGVWRSKLKAASFSGIGIRIKCPKNSLSETHREILTRMKWWNEPIGHNPVTDMPILYPRTVWDWGWSTVDLLSKATGVVRERLKEYDLLVNVKSPTADVECMAQCKALGMGKTDWENFSTVGEAIHANPVLMEKYRSALAIERNPVLRGSYEQQLQQMVENIE